MKTTNFDFHNDLRAVILWQYLDANNINALVDKEQEFLDAALTNFIVRWRQKVLNIKTADTFGLGLWGKLLGVPRPTTAGGVPFSDEEYRIILRATAGALTFDGSIKGLMNFLHEVFPALLFEIKDTYQMVVEIRVVNLDVATEEEKTILRDYAYLLPRPSGVKYWFSDFLPDYSNTLGFDDGQETPDYAGFEQGTFYT